MIRSGVKVKACTVYGGRDFCSHALSLSVTVFCLHGNVLYFVLMFVSFLLPCLAESERVCVCVGVCGCEPMYVWRGDGTGRLG